MDPSTQFCPNYYCLNRGIPGRGNIRVHSRTGHTWPLRIDRLPNGGIDVSIAPEGG